jgi:transcriptional regulator with XRE-family HTH domain
MSDYHYLAGFRLLEMDAMLGQTSFAQKLQRLREAAGLSQYALAKRSGVSKQALSKLEMGEREPTWATVQKLALALSVGCQEFLDPGVIIPTAAESAPGKRGRPPKALPAPSPAGELEQEAATRHQKTRPPRKGK